MKKLWAESLNGIHRQSVVSVQGSGKECPLRPLSASAGLSVHVNVEEYPFFRGNNGKEVGQSNFRTNSAPSSPALSYRNRDCSFLVLVRFFCCHFTAAHCCH